MSASRDAKLPETSHIRDKFCNKLLITQYVRCTITIAQNVHEIMHRLSECTQNVFLCASSLMFLTHCPNTWMSHDVSVDICSQRHSEGMQRRVCWCLGNTLNAVGPTQVWLHHLSIPWKMQLSENVPILEFKMNRIKYALIWAGIICLALKKSATEWLVCLFVCLFDCFIHLSTAFPCAFDCCRTRLTPVSCTTMSEWQRGQSRPCVASWWVGKRKMVSAWLPADQSEPRMLPVRSGIAEKAGSTG